MNKLKTTALMLITLVSAVPFLTGCQSDTVSSSVSVSYVENENIGKNKHEADLGASVTVDTTTFTVHNVIDVNKTSDDGGKYIYVKYTIKNSSDKNFKVDNLNNFYISIDGKNYNNDVRANLYAKQSIKDYVELDSVPAGEEVTNYVGFIVPENTKSVTCGYYVTSGEKTDKQDTIICEVASSEWIQPPADMLK